ncbi:MAG: NADH-ubiquinone oxidoreductase-F iron-sulfur binding region domain-containing protein [Bacteroidales bacterium]|nr:NADH-ubiquinone oxidoreductase-F iron-sulfur binding region domain-containing protein [Bacteroidales bacterium]MDY0217480.1 NADH-ubiquinone oxidoreductase-F iron-sulfur binding region domain-containing protein [Bacteroidales bacterium]
MAEKTLKRVDLIFSEDNYREIIEKTFAKTDDEIINEMIDSGLKGRGGAGFLTGLKWKFARDAKSVNKHVICNADEGEPGTFKDREILDKVAQKVFTGMAIAARVVGAKKGYIYLRGEYRFLVPKLLKELKEFHAIMKAVNFDFEIDIFMGSGAYVCGEETALLESMEGRRGEPRNKPPFPVIEGYLGQPTVVNNVETLASAAMVCKIGSQSYKRLGTKSSRGSKLFSVSGDTPIAGVYELELGMSLQEFVDEFGDGDTKAVQVGGASGFCVPRKKFPTTIIGYQSDLEGDNLPTGGSMMIFNSSRSMYNLLRNYLDFFVEESCGQCTPCRVGTQQLIYGIEAVKRGDKNSSYLDYLLKLTETMKMTAKCGLGQSVANSFSSIVTNFKEEMIY